MKTIPLTRGYFAKVDDDDYIYLAGFRWYASIYRNGMVRADRWGKVSDGEKKDRHITMSRVIMKDPKGKYVDHINGDTLDNRKKNLRVVTPEQNSHNRGMSKNNTSGYKGVSFDKRVNKWHVSIWLKRKAINIGYFDSVKEAVFAYDKASIKYHGKYGRPNSLILEGK